MISPHEVFNALGRNITERQKSYQKLFDEKLDQLSIGDIRIEVKSSQPIGKESFILALTLEVGRKITKECHGGDSRSESYRKTQVF